MTETIVWYEAAACGVEGKGWLDTAKLYDRLPAHAEGAVPDAVWALSRYPSGLSFTFETDATHVLLRWWLGTQRLSASNMTPIALAGVDCYAGELESNETWRWMGVGAETTLIPSSSTLGLNLSPAVRLFRVYLPLFTTVDRVMVGLPNTATWVPILPDPRPPIVYYGTSIVNGLGVSRPGRALPAVLGRRLDRPVVNLGFSGVGRMDIELASLLAEIDAAVYIVDCLPNMDSVLVSARAVPFITALRAVRPLTPIILVEDRTYGNAWARPDLAARNDESRTALQTACATLRAAGVPNISCVPGPSLLGEDDTTDGSHPSDLGVERYVDHLAPIVEAVAW